MHARADAPQEQGSSWPDEIFSILQHFDVGQVPYVPDAGHSRLIDLCRNDPAIASSASGSARR